MTIRRRDSVSSIPKKLSPSEVRAKVVDEILNTERDYVRHLEDIVEVREKEVGIYCKLMGERLYAYSRKYCNSIHYPDGQELDFGQVICLFGRRQCLHSHK